MSRKHKKQPELRNPRFVWIVGAIYEQFPDIPENFEDPHGMILWDRQERTRVATVHNGYAQAMCLELTTSAFTMPFTTMCDWFNSLDDEALTSEGMTPTDGRYDRV